MIKRSKSINLYIVFINSIMFESWSWMNIVMTKALNQMNNLFGMHDFKSLSKSQLQITEFIPSKISPLCFQQPFNVICQTFMSGLLIEPNILLAAPSTGF